MKRCILRKYAALLALTLSAVWFMPIACTKSSSEGDSPDEPVTGVITMTTQASEMFFYIETGLENDNILIDWGDGEGSKTYKTSCESLYCYLNVSQSYSGDSEHHITIKGENIEFLYCGGHNLIERNQITALDVSGCTTLKKLDCSFNQLSVLDVSRNTELETLNCNSNLLTNLDVSRNTALKELYCWSNQLTTLDVNTALEDLTCSYNQLTDLDVSKCIRLGYLSCGNNQITTLDMSSNTWLTHLYVPYNQLTASALNDLFQTLRVSPGSQLKYNPHPDPWFWLNIDENPGTNDCDFYIAWEKGWWVYPHFNIGD